MFNYIILQYNNAVKEIVKEDKMRVLRFDMGDDVITGLVEYCQKEGINAGSFTALGACKDWA